MLIKNYLVKKNFENSTLKLQDNQFVMTKKDPTKSNIYLTSADLKTGVIHNQKHIFGRVEIQAQANSQYALKECGINKYFSSSPVNNIYDFSYIEKDKTTIGGWEVFDLKETDAISLTLSDFFDFISHAQYNPINLFWWRGNDYRNFGDELNPHIVSFLSKRTINKTDILDIDLLGIGSILDWAIPRQRKYAVWGSGTLKPTYINENYYKPYLLRGPLTHSLFTHSSEKIPYGDPGLLSCRIWEGSQEKLYDWGIIPHHSQRNKPWVQNIKKNNPNTIIIDVTSRDAQSIMHKVSACKAIASSSLHGLVIADSYQVPSIWLWDNAIHPGGQWKFFDYFAGIGRHMIDNINPNNLESLDAVHLHPNNYAYFKQINKICDRIVDSFPL